MATSAAEYGSPALPSGSKVVEMASGPGAPTPRLSACAAEVSPTASVTVTEEVDVPGTSGVPLIMPLEMFIAAQAGKDPLETFQV